MQYFDHSTTAASDDKVLTLRMDHGGAAVDAYWAILEQIYNDESACKAGAKRALSHRLCTTPEQLETWISAMLELGLLETDADNPDSITSERAMGNIRRYQEKCETARQNASKRGTRSGGKAGAKRALKNTSTTAEPPADNKTKQNKGIDCHKGNQIPCAADGAAAGEPAPPSAPVCGCGTPMEPTNSYAPNRTARYWSCPSCGESVAVRGDAPC